MKLVGLLIGSNADAALAMNATASAKGRTRKPSSCTSRATSGIMKSTAASFVRKIVTSAAMQTTARYKRRSEPFAKCAASWESQENIRASSAAATIVARPPKNRSTSHCESTVAAAVEGVKIPQRSIKPAPMSAVFHSEMRPARKTIAAIVRVKITTARKACVTLFAAVAEVPAVLSARIWG